MNTPHKVLHIEDDIENRRLVQYIIESKNLKYHFAENGLKGLRLAEEIKPDLILVDISLPDLEGYEITTYLKNLPELSDTNIVAVTGYSDSETRLLTKAAGCDDFIAKPFDVAFFSKQLDLWLSPHKLTKAEPPSLHLLQKYNTQLVSKLISKITDLENLNHDLRELNKKITTSKKELEIYNDRLLYLNRLTNFFQEHKNPSELLRLLPTKILESFPISRCIFYGIWNKSLLKPYSYALLEHNPDPLDVSIEPELLDLLTESNNLLFVETVNNTNHPAIQKIARELSSESFILAQLSGESEGLSAEISHPDDMIVRKYKSDIPDKVFIFIEPKSSEYLFSLYEKRILISFLQTMKNIFENSLLFDNLIKLYKEREEEAIRDGLTKLYNFRYFMNALEREISRGKRFNGVFSLLMIDIDYFKQYNDRMGHLKGDRILSTLTSLLELNTRKIDVVARYGGEEFTIILPGIGKDNAFLIANKLREIIDYYHFPDQEGQPGGNLTISTGLASFPDDAQTAKELIDNADKALYKAKELGRNRVCVYGIDVK